MTIETIQLDWRGMCCPEPILKTARKVRKLRDGNERRIQVYADDDAFPVDIESWCKSSGVSLMGVEKRDGFYEAILELPAENAKQLRRPAHTNELTHIVREPAKAAPPQSAVLRAPDQSVHTLDCVGMACPEPILKLARAYRKLGDGESLLISADDDAFPVDVKSWLKSSGAKLVSLDESASPFQATITKPGPSIEPGPSVEPSPTSHTPLATHRAQAAPVRRQPHVSSGVLHLALDGLNWGDAMARLESMTGPAWAGETLEVKTSDASHLQQIVSWLAQAGHQLLMFDAAEGIIRLGVSDTASDGSLASPSSHALIPASATKRATFLVIHNDFESLMAALMVANTTAAQNIETSIFFSFWGVNLLRGDRPRVNEPTKPMTIIHRMFRWMMPKGPSRQPLSKMHFGGAGKAMMLASMRQQNVMDLEALMESAIESGVQFTVCTMSMSIMGIQKRDIMERDNISFAGVASFVSDSAGSDISMVF